jgi:hypothetical protein
VWPNQRHRRRQIYRRPAPRLHHTDKPLSMSRDLVHWMDGSRSVLIALVVAEEAARLC